MKSVKFSRESQSKSSRTSDSKMEIFPWISNIYRWRIYLWIVSYALRKTANTLNSARSVSVSGTRSLSVRASDGASESRFKLKRFINYRLLYLTSFFYSPSYKACHMFRTNCIMHFLRSSSVCVLPRYFIRCARIKLLYININCIAS